MKAVSYTRVSTERQGESGLGLDSQTKSVEAFADQRGFKVLTNFNEVESGKNNQRPKLKEAIELCKREKATLLIAKLDRLSRNAAFLHSLKDELTAAGVDVIAVDMQEALSNTLMLSVMAGMAQHEREMISDRTKKALAEKKARGEKLGRPKGYKHSAETKAKISKANRKGAAAFDPMVLNLACLSFSSWARVLRVAMRTMSPSMVIPS